MATGMFREGELDEAVEALTAMNELSDGFGHRIIYGTVKLQSGRIVDISYDNPKHRYDVGCPR